MTAIITVEGTVLRITYRNEATWYTVVKVQTELPPLPGADRAGIITAVGSLPAVDVGQTVRLTGSWEQHPQYGRQLKVDQIQSVWPATAAAIERYLASGAIRGVGPTTAQRLVARFGADTLRVFEHQPDLLQSIPGIGPQKARQISQAFAENKDSRDVMLFLQGHGITPGLAGRIHRKYGTETIRVVQENPYRVAEEIHGIGFRTADRIAAELGIGRDSVARAAAAILHVLRDATSEGHVCLPKDELVERTAALVEMDASRLHEALEDLRERDRVRLDDSQNVYLPVYYSAEVSLAARIRELITPGPETKPSEQFETEMNHLQTKLQIRLAEQQIEAIRYALNSSVLVITGGPGTGKTTLLRALLDLFKTQGQKVALASPTGRAAKRLSEATGREAKTVHRLLEFGPTGESGRFGRNETNRLDASVVVIDEASMLDLMLTLQLTKALRPGTRLILVGDADQLPSVGAGSVLRDLIDSGSVPVVRLTEVFRQAKESLIVTNAHRVNRGEIPEVNQGRDFFLVEEDDHERIAHTVCELVSERLPRYFGCDPSSDIQVLAAVRGTQAGIDALNEALRDVLNPPASGRSELRVGDRSWRVGDKVMQIRNNYDLGVWNGDIGHIERLDEEQGQIMVRIDERGVSYALDQLDELAPAFAMTIHKSQGNEFPVVVVPLVHTMRAMMSRNLLYTAITRARQVVVLVGSRWALSMYVSNAEVTKRHSRLADRLRR